MRKLKSCRFQFNLSYTYKKENFGGKKNYCAELCTIKKRVLIPCTVNTHNHSFENEQFFN